MTTPTLPHSFGGATRRKMASAALVSVTVVGGVVASGQFAGASAPSGTVVPPATEPAAEPADDLADVAFEMDSFDITPDIAEQFERFDACMNEQLGDELYPIFDIDEIDLGHNAFEMDWNGGVFIETGDLSDLGDFIEFGEGDATITITKEGDEVSVVVDGDAETIDLSEFDDAEMIDVGLADGDVDDADWAEFDAAAERCDALFPVEFDDAFGDGAVVIDSTGGAADDTDSVPSDD